jgi:hypothetical protein
MKIMESCGIAVAKSPAEIGREMANALGISASEAPNGLPRGILHFPPP